MLRAQKINTLHLVLTLAIALLASVPTAGAEGWGERLEEDLPLDPLLTTGVLDNGLTYYIRHNESPEDRVELWLVVDAGSTLEDEDQLGVAHFVEHMAFNGTEKYQRLELVDYLETIGMRFGPDINATTSFDETVYMLRIPTDQPELVDTGLDILHQWASAVTFDEEEVDKERGVVTEEWRLGLGFASRIRDKQFPLLFRDSVYEKRLPIGTPEVIGNVSVERVRDFYRDWYRPELMAVIAVGDIDRAEMAAKIEAKFGSLTNGEEPRPRPTHQIPDHEETLYGVATDPETSHTTFAIFNKLPKRAEGRVKDYRQWIVERIYHMMVNTRLEEYTRGPSPPFLAAGSSSGRFVRSKHVTTLVAAVGEGEVSGGMYAVLRELQRLARFGFTEGELERAKAEYMRTYERAALDRDAADSSSYAAEYIRVHLVDEPTPGIAVELELVQEFVPQISLKEMNFLAALNLGERNRVILVSAPERHAQRLPSEEEALEIFSQVADAELVPYIDSAPDRPLISELPESGAIAGEEYIEELDITVWELSNGAQVVLKPTDFRSDQVLVSAFSPGGNSLVSDDDFASSLVATAFVEESGVGAFDPLSLDKALAGKTVDISTYIDELEEGLDASASSRDLEEMFQLIYLVFTEPRLDDDAVRSVMGRVRGWVHNRSTHPEIQFEDRMNSVLTGDHPRRRAPTRELLKAVDASTALEVYGDRFGDASDFTFVIVGSFATEDMRPFVNTYLASLPTQQRQETWRDIGVDGPDEVERVEVFSGLEPKSQVRLVFSGGAEFGPQNLYNLRSTAAALGIRLREALREDLGATYGVRVSTNMTDRPSPGYTATIEFGCAPENVDTLVTRIFEEIESVRESGLADSYTTKVREQQRRRRQTMLRENGFWLRALSEYYRHGWDPRLLLQHDQLLANLNSETFQQTTALYFDPDKYVLGVLYPKEAEAAEPTDNVTGM